MILVLFSWACSQFCLLVLFNFNMMTFVLLCYFVMFCCYLLGACSFLTRGRKERRTSRCERWRRTEGTEEKETVFRLYFRRKDYLLFKRGWGGVKGGRGDWVPMACSYYELMIICHLVCWSPIMLLYFSILHTAQINLIVHFNMKKDWLILPY